MSDLEKVGKLYTLWPDQKRNKWGMESTFYNFKMNAYAQP